jgi:hypothetical protein
VSAGAELVSWPRRRKEKEEKRIMKEKIKDTGNIRKIW